jgi:hypothetical protein
VNEAGQKSSSFSYLTQIITNAFRQILNKEKRNREIKDQAIEIALDAHSDIEINFALLPSVDLGNDTSFCAQDGTGLLLDAGNPGSTYFWSTGDTSQTLSVDTLSVGYGDHTISVEVTTAEGCISNDEISVDVKNCTGIINPDNITKVSVYPNPGSGRFNLDISVASFQKVDLLVLDNQGKIVYQQINLSLEGQKTVIIDLSGKASGVYQLLIKGKNSMINKKLIIH